MAKRTPRALHIFSVIDDRVRKHYLQEVADGWFTGVLSGGVLSGGVDFV